MAEETDLSRTEPPSPRRLQEARRAGDVPRSGELTAWLVLLAALGVLGWQGPRLLFTLQDLSSVAFGNAAHLFSPLLRAPAQAVLWALLPVLAAVFAAALVAPMLLSGWVYAPTAVRTDLARANPVKALSRLLAADGWFDAMRAVLKLLTVGAAVWWALASGWDALPAGGGRAALADAAAWVGRGVVAVAAALAVAAGLDAAWRWWRYLRRHAMTYQEVLAEAREAELPAEVRAQLQARQQQAGRGAFPSKGAHPEGHKGANARPTSIDEVIG